MPDEPAVLFSVEGAVATLTLHRPGQRNTWNRALWQERRSDQVHAALAIAVERREPRRVLDHLLGRAALRRRLEALGRPVVPEV
jgi:hypothetical protein